MYKVGIECESIEERGWGVGRIVAKLLEEISRESELQEEFRFCLYFKSRIPDYEFLKNPIFIKKIIRQPFGLKSFSLYYYLLLPLKLYFEHLDVMFYPNYMLPLIHYGKSIVTLTGDIHYEITKGDLPFRYKLAYKIFAGNAARNATAITTVSESAAKEICELFKIMPGRIFVTPLGVDAAKFQKATNYKLETRNYLLYVAQAFPRRHLRETILAVDKLSDEFPDLKLIAIGKDRYPSMDSGQVNIIQSLAEEINKKHNREVIIYKEYVPENELIALYQNAKSFIYVSLQEAFGLPPLEALAAGSVPVVAESELNREIYGGQAFTVKTPIAVDEIAKAIKESLVNETKRIEIFNKAPDILAKYTWRKHTDLFLDVVRKTIKL